MIIQIPDTPKPSLCFNEEASETAHKEWNATCGPHSIAAALGISLDQVRQALPPYKGWMNPTMVGETLRTLGKNYTFRKGLKTDELCNGINRIQWEGKWLNPGVPARAAYFHTHYVAHFNGWVLCTACLPWEWISVGMWRHLLLEGEEPSPFHITHHYSLDQKDG